jgi:hypothetical protein
MTITIPTWLLWTVGLAIGVPLVVFILMCAYIGFMFVSSFGRRGGLY